MISQKTAVSVASGTVLVLAISFFMQKTADERAAEYYVNAAELGKNQAETDAIALDDITYTSLESDTAETNEVPDTSLSAPDCEPTLTAHAKDNAMVALTIKAPCLGPERLRIHHMGLVLQERLSALGTLTLRVPAMTQQAVFLVDFETVPDLVATVSVSGLEQMDRIAFQEPVGGGLELHALEFGANYGENGHVWIGANNGVGFMFGESALPGSTALQSPAPQIYSLPHGRASERQTEFRQVHFSIEAEITGANCGRAFEADLLQTRAGRFSVRSVTVEMPECELTGDFLVLNNLIESLKIVQN